MISLADKQRELLSWEGLHNITPTYKQYVDELLVQLGVLDFNTERDHNPVAVLYWIVMLQQEQIQQLKQEVKKLNE